MAEYGGRPALESYTHRVVEAGRAGRDEEGGERVGREVKLAGRSVGVTLALPCKEIPALALLEGPGAHVMSVQAVDWRRQRGRWRRT